MDRGTWQITACGVTKSWTQLHMHSHVPKADYLAGSVLNVSHTPPSLHSHTTPPWSIIVPTLEEQAAVVRAQVMAQSHTALSHGAGV